MHRRHRLSPRHKIAVLFLSLTTVVIVLISILIGIPDSRFALVITAVCMLAVLGLSISSWVIYERLLELRLYSDYILQSITRGVIAVGLDGKIRMMNSAAYKLLGKEEKRIDDLDYRNFLADNEVCKQLITDVLKKRQTVENKEIDSISPSGDHKALQLNTAVLRDIEGREVGAILLIKDLSELKLLQARIRRADTLAALGRITASLAHEIKNPLNGISLNIELLEEALLDEELKHPGEIGEHIRVIAGEIKRLNDLMKNLSRFVAAPKMKMSKIDVNENIERVLNLVKIETRDQGIEIVKDLGSVPRINGDSAQIQQVILNIVLNAIEAMDRGGTIRIKTRWDRVHNAVQISISDSGHGMSQEEQDRIFEFYYTTKENGTGMGLPIALKIIKDHGGEIDVESAVGVGTTFTITIPTGGNSNDGKDIDRRG